MFQLTIKNQNITEHFESRDNLMIRLETENKKCKTESLEAICQLIQTNKDGEVVDKMTLDLPLLDQGLDEVLLGFGKSKPRIPKPINPKKAKDTKNEMKVKVDEATVPTTEAVTRKVKRKSSLMPFMILLLSLTALVLSLLNYVNVQKQVQQIITLEKNQVSYKPQEDDMGARDVFCRYFLPNYYSGQKGRLDNFIDSNTKINSQEGVLQSVLLESHKSNNGQMTLTYVIALKEKEETFTKRISLSVKKQTNSHYGYVVTKTPKISQYP
ncbi:hypothetical protein PJ261_02230 [Streptococcus dysgalactiae]|uniref:hypothetical protein n=1 Tax=Streptococcus dysgalactiae TaxID=1334 RepID=UPI0035CEDF47